jgi:hypothetical protein
MKNNAFTVRVSDSFKNELEEYSKKRKISVSEAISDLLKVGTLMNRYVDKDTQVILKKAKGFKEDEQLILPVSELQKQA